MIRLRGDKFKSYIDTFVPPLSFAKQHLGDLTSNAARFLAGDFHVQSGMKHLIDAFYRAVTDGTPLPIPYREILLTARIMDAIFSQIGTNESPAALQCRLKERVA